MKYTESAVIYNKIKEKSGLNDEALALLKITKDVIDKAMHQCVSKGMSRKHAMRTIYKMWNYSDDAKESNGNDIKTE